MGHIRGLVGTQVHLKAVVNKPLEFANLRVKDQPPVKVPLSNNGRKLEIDFVISEAGVYSWWFDLRDLEGFENANAPRYEIRGIADLVPDVWIDEPPRDEDVTPTAMVPIKVGAKDDMGLREIRLQYKIGSDDKTPFTAIPLFDGKDRPQQHAVEYKWELGGLKLQPGREITFHAEALDDYNLEGAHVGRSITRKLTIVSPEEKTSELASQQGRLVDELDAAHKQQIQTHDQVQELKIQLQKAGELRFEDIDLLKRLEIEQRQINSRLSHPVEGVAARAESLLKELARNRINDPDMEQRLKGIATEIGIMQEDHLPTIEQELTNARKLAQTKQGLTPEENPEDKPKSAKTDAPKSRDEETALGKAEDNQQAVLDSLGDMLAQLSEWRHHRDLTGEVRELIGQQEDLNRETADVGKRTFGKSERQLSPQEQADLARLADRQRKQAQRISGLSKSFEDIAKELEKTSPQAAELLTDADDHLRQQAVAGNLRETANQLGRNQIGEATQQQQQALEDLSELSDILKNKSVSDTETLVKKLKQSREELEPLRKRQEELLRKVEEAEKIADPNERERELERLRQEQQQIRREISSMARRLRRLQARGSGSSLRRASSRMEQAEQLLQEDQRNQAEQEQREVLDDLEQAERELAEEERRAEEQLAREMLERIGDELKSMIAREQTVIEETNRLEALRRQESNWSRAQLKTLRDLAEVQRGLKTETDGLVEVVKAAEVFALALKGAAREMEFAAKRLEDRQTDGETVARESAAKNRFTDLIAALEPDKPKKTEDPAQDGGGGGAAANAGPQGEAIPHIAQLKMLKTLQEDLIRRTETLDRVQKETGALTDDQKLELDLLAGEQGQLADLMRNLTAQFAQAFKSEPGKPDDQPQPKPEPKPEPKKAPGKGPSLEDQLNKDLDLDNLIPKSKPKNTSDEKPPQADRLRSELNLRTAKKTTSVFEPFNKTRGLTPPARLLIPNAEVLFFAILNDPAAFAYPAQIELKKTNADELPPSEAKKPPANDADKTKTDKQPAVKPKLDKKLFEELVGQDPQAAAGDPTKNPLEEAIQGMRSAQERISGKDTGEETREIQEQVVANLQKLIDRMKDRQSQPPSASSGSPPPDQPQQPEDGNPNPQQGAREPNQNKTANAQGEESQQPQRTKQENEDATESTSDHRNPAKGGNADLAPRPDMVNAVWGHLPPSVRLKLRNLSSDKYLPKYEDLARRYFEALAEPVRNPTMKPRP